MKGVIFNLLEEAVSDSFGSDTWEDLLEAAGLDGAYTSLGSYPDEEIAALVQAASDALGKSPGDILRWFGRTAMPRLAQRYPQFFECQPDGRAFVLSVNAIIHPEVRKLYAGAGCPNFHFREDPDSTLMIGYQSPRQLCDLAHGFIEGAADHYGQTVAIDHVACMKSGDALCRIATRWSH